MSKKGYLLILILALVAGFIGGSISDPLLDRVGLKYTKPEYAVSTGYGGLAIKFDKRTGQAWHMTINRDFGVFSWEPIDEEEELEELIEFMKQRKKKRLEKQP
jgi:hypothetical protein